MHFWPFHSLTSTNPITVDFHSHLIPGVDDGVGNVEEVFTILKSFAELGYKKIITTPHIYPDVYPNQEEDLKVRHKELVIEIEKEGIGLEFQLAAEYFLHEELLAKVKAKKRLLSFGKKKYLLFETGFHQKPMIWEEVIFELQIQGYQPVLAHPERYAYICDNIGLVRGWRNQGIRIQMNISSLLGFYGKEVQKTAKELVKNNLVDFLCSDLHREDQLEALLDAPKNKLFQRAALLVQNNEL